MSCVSYVVACLGIRTFDRNRREGGLETSRLLMTHGYMLSGTGSNVYVQNLCRALAGMGHDVHLLCQEPNPLSYDFVNAHYRASARGVEKLGGQATPYAGSCHVYQPEIGDLLPVYVYDDYPGWRVKTFLAPAPRTPASSTAAPSSTSPARATSICRSPVGGSQRPRKLSPSPTTALAPLPNTFLNLTREPSPSPAAWTPTALGPTPSTSALPAPSSEAPAAVPERWRGCMRSSTDSPTGGAQRISPGS